MYNFSSFWFVLLSPIIKMTYNSYRPWNTRWLLFGTDYYSISSAGIEDQQQFEEFDKTVSKSSKEADETGTFLHALSKLQPVKAEVVIKALTDFHIGIQKLF
jgi:hypothetical protein